MIQTGYYKHYKGGLYIVVGTAEHTETTELLVLYSPIENRKKVWARPAGMFLQNVEYLGMIVPRFEFLHG